MARNDPQMNLRVPMELKEKIEKAALENGRTITAESVYRLEESFKGGVDEINDFIAFIESQSKEMPNNQANAILVTLFKNWLAFNKAP